MGQKEEGLKMIKNSYSIGKQAGFPGVEDLAELIEKLEKSLGASEET